MSRLLLHVSSFAYLFQPAQAEFTLHFWCGVHRSFSDRDPVASVALSLSLVKDRLLEEAQDVIAILTDDAMQLEEKKQAYDLLWAQFRENLHEWMLGQRKLGVIGTINTAVFISKWQQYNQHVQIIGCHIFGLVVLVEKIW